MPELLTSRRLTVTLPTFSNRFLPPIRVRWHKLLLPIRYLSQCRRNYRYNQDLKLKHSAVQSTVATDFLAVSVVENSSNTPDTTIEEPPAAEQIQYRVEAAASLWICMPISVPSWVLC